MRKERLWCVVLKMVIAVLVCLLILFLLPLAVALFFALVGILLELWWIPFVLLIIAFILHMIEE